MFTCLTYGARLYLQLGPHHRRPPNDRPNRLILRIRTHLRRLDVDPCASETRLEAAQRGGPHSELSQSPFQVRISFLLLRIRIYLRRRDVDPCAYWGLDSM